MLRSVLQNAGRDYKLRAGKRKGFKIPQVRGVDQMTTFEIYLSITSVVVSVAMSWWMLRIAKYAGRDRPHDPERVRRFIEDAPYDALDKVMKP
jgi:hypothetical protein